MAGRHGHSRKAISPRPTLQLRGRLSDSEPPAEVQVFGRRDSRETQKALRFFRERGVRTVFVDLNHKPLAVSELRRLSSRFTSAALIDQESRAYRQAGLAYMRLDEDETFARLLASQLLLRLPLVRAGSRLSVGAAEDVWRAWLSPLPDQ